jgi:ribosomal protein S21
MQELRLRQYYEKPTLKRQRKHKESLRRSAKAKKLKFLREVSSE